MRSRYHFYLVVGMLILLRNVIISSETFSEQYKLIEPGDGEEHYCNQMKRNFHIIPGQSFGNLPIREHATYLQARCYRFFCEPHEMAGKGKFPCIPLKKDK